MTDNYDLSLADYKRMENENDDAPRFERAINDADGRVLYVPYGEYKISSPIIIKNGTSLLMHPKAKLIAISKMDYVLNCDFECKKQGIDVINAFITGGIIDGNGMASCMFITGCRHFKLSDISFLNGKQFGLRAQRPGYELLANNLYCKCNMSGLAGNTGIRIDMGDSHYTDCIVVDYTVGIEVTAGSSRLTRCHVWGGCVPPKEKDGVPEMLENSVCFKIGTCFGNDCVLRYCYADTANIGFEIHDNTRMAGCAYLNNPIFRLDGITVIDHQRGYLTVSDGFFRVCDNHAVFYKGQNKTVRWGDNYLEGIETEFSE